jgi:hypothetical protein
LTKGAARNGQWCACTMFPACLATFQKKPSEIISGCDERDPRLSLHPTLDPRIFMPSDVALTNRGDGTCTRIKFRGVEGVRRCEWWRELPFQCEVVRGSGEVR